MAQASAGSSAVALVHYELSIIVSQPLFSPRPQRLHWAIYIKRSDLERGHMFHVLSIDATQHFYQYDRRDDVTIAELECQGLFKVATFETSTYSKVTSIIEKEDPPRNGKGSCQDWVFNCLLEMENNDVIPSTTCHWVHPFMNLALDELIAKLGTGWTRA